jgi:hypothetical protein
MAAPVFYRADGSAAYPSVRAWATGTAGAALPMPHLWRGLRESKERWEVAVLVKGLGRVEGIPGRSPDPGVFTVLRDDLSLVAFPEEDVLMPALWIENIGIAARAQYAVRAAVRGDFSDLLWTRQSICAFTERFLTP